MIYEYALDPTLLLDRRLAGLLAGSFGESRGRLISEFPEHWEALVYASLADALPVHRNRVIELLNRLTRRMIASGRVWDDADGDDWFGQAVRAHGQQPFRAIVAGQNPNRRNFVLQAEDLDDINPLWYVETNRTIRRTAAEMSGCLETLLACAQEVIFVDYYFEPVEQRWLRPLSSFLDYLRRRRPGVPLRRVEFHTQARPRPHFAHDCAGALANVVPQGMPFKVVRWEPHEDLHNRYVLTNRGGIGFLHGLDDGPGSDDVTLLSDSTHATRWGEYQRPSPLFTFFDETVVVGRRR